MLANSKPIISIVMPTYNSAKVLVKVLSSIRNQSYPKTKVEILIVDGGSKDDTVKIANEFGCKVIPNPQVGIMEAEILGFGAAKGKYLVGLAPDEVLENPNSLMLKYKAFQKDKRVKSVLPSGYKTPQDYSPINYYVNEFGDPFSYFMYRRESKGYQFLAHDLKQNYTKVDEDNDCVIFSFANSKYLPLIELWAGGCMLDLSYVRSTFPEVGTNSYLIPLIFYLLNKKGSLLGVTKNDPTVHYSSGTVSKYLKKIRSRVEWNVYHTPMGQGGFLGRKAFEPQSTKYRKYLFPLYSFSIILPFIDSLYLSITRRQLIFMLHLPLCVYTSYLIGYYYLLKLLNIRHTIKLYGH